MSCVIDNLEKRLPGLKGSAVIGKIETYLQEQHPELYLKSLVSYKPKAVTVVNKTTTVKEKAPISKIQSTYNALKGIFTKESDEKPVDTPKVKDKKTTDSTKPTGKVTYPKFDKSRTTSPVFNDGYVDVLRKSNTDMHFGNPFGVTGITVGKDTIANSGTVDEVSTKYANWIRGVSDTDVYPERRAWIVEQIKSGKLDGMTLKYMYTMGTPAYSESKTNHAVELGKLVKDKSWLDGNTPVAEFGDQIGDNKVTPEEAKLLETDGIEVTLDQVTSGGKPLAIPKAEDGIIDKVNKIASTNNSALSNTNQIVKDNNVVCNS